jgi:hypothetical protein
MTTIENGVLKPSGVVQLRGGTFEAMSEANPLLARREVAVEIDTGKIKVGDGVTSWNDLPYAGGGGFEWPESDDNVYVIKNGAFVQARLVQQPTEWEPIIDDENDIVLTLDEDMTPYQLTGRNLEVNS